MIFLDCERKRRRSEEIYILGHQVAFHSPRGVGKGVAPRGVATGFEFASAGAAIQFFMSFQSYR